MPPSVAAIRTGSTAGGALVSTARGAQFESRPVLQRHCPIAAIPPFFAGLSGGAEVVLASASIWNDKGRIPPARAGAAGSTPDHSNITRERRGCLYSYYEYGGKGSNRLITVETVSDEFDFEVLIRAVPVRHKQLIGWFTSGFE